MADWKAIETEYITTDTSYRKLAQKYGVDQSTVSRKGKDGHWVEKKEQYSSNLQAKILTSVTESNVSKAEKLNSAAELLLDKVTGLIDACNPRRMDTQSLKHISGTLKDIKDILMIRSDADMEEQRARISKLQADAARGDDTGGGIAVTLEGSVGEYGE